MDDEITWADAIRANNPVCDDWRLTIASNNPLDPEKALAQTRAAWLRAAELFEQQHDFFAAFL